MFRFSPSILCSIQAASEREWLLTDGLGGYAMGTLGGLRTRRAHGLLVIAERRPNARHLALAAMDVTVCIGDRRISLATTDWADGTTSAGNRRLTRCDVSEGLPRWYWAVDGTVVSLQIAMAHGRPAVGLHYRIEQAAEPVTLEFEPIVTWRPIDGERPNGTVPHLDHDESGVVVDNKFRVRGPDWTPGGQLQRGIRYRNEDSRSHAATEDLLSAGTFRATLATGESVDIEAWAGDLNAAPPTAQHLVLAAQVRHRLLAESSGCYDDLDRALVLSADSFITLEGDVMAGYPWLGERTRDSLIAYAGLFLETGRITEGRAYLVKMLSQLEGGLLPEPADIGPRRVTTADGSLWLMQAIYRHVLATDDRDLASAAVPVFAQTINFLVGGTFHAVGIDPTDGLLTLRHPDKALTWMDATEDGIPTTARVGKPVELNALWLSGLSILRDLAARVGRVLPSNKLDATARQAFARFGGHGTGLDGGLADLLDGYRGIDRTLRPNQLLAVSLPFAPWHNAEAVVRAVEPLVANVGLRTLDRRHDDYRGTHAGGPDDHQGTAWSWLIGPYADALRVAKIARPGILNGVEDHIPTAGIGSVSAMFDGDPMFAPAGCPFHAASVAETLRIRRSLR